MPCGQARLVVTVLPSREEQQEGGVVAPGGAASGIAASICFVRSVLLVMISLLTALQRLPVCCCGMAGRGVQSLLGRLFKEQVRQMFCWGSRGVFDVQIVGSSTMFSLSL